MFVERDVGPGLRHLINAAAKPKAAFELPVLTMCMDLTPSLLVPQATFLRDVLCALMLRQILLPADWKILCKILNTMLHRLRNFARVN